MSDFVWFEIASPVCTWRGVVSERGVVSLLPAASAPFPPAGARRDDANPAARELSAYFAGKLRAFTVPVDLSGLPAFRRRVLERLCEIPFGAVTTYGELARAAGSPGAARAVGGAVGANPVPVIVPCHRVIAAGGRIGGFGLGLPMKRALLALETRATTRVAPTKARRTQT